MAELVDALVSEASEETHGGSSPLGHTKRNNGICEKPNVFYFINL